MFYKKLTAKRDWKNLEQWNHLFKKEVKLIRSIYYSYMIYIFIYLFISKYTSLVMIFSLVATKKKDVIILKFISNAEKIVFY